MGFAAQYLEKHQFIKIDIPRVPEISGLLTYIVIIPAFSEPEIFSTLNSLKNCQQPKGEVEILILVNFSEVCNSEIKQANLDLFVKLKEWSLNNSSQALSFIPLLASNLPKKHAGAGLARKTLMDIATARFNNINKPDGIIISLDADCIVPSNYFIEIESANVSFPDTGCYIFNFEHPLNGDKFPIEVYNAITLYELHIRYYKQILEYINYPYFLYTIGSCFAVSARTYVKTGGMNRRKAGEDFYFLQKVFAVEKTLFLKTIVVAPSPRPSERVHFGTGPAIRKILSSENNNLETYTPQSFLELKPFFDLIPLFYKEETITYPEIIDQLSDGIKNYLIENKYSGKIREIKANCSNEKTFTKRFYHWFDAFTVLKYLNYVRENNFGPMEITKAVKKFLNLSEDKPELLLEFLRKRDTINS